MQSFVEDYTQALFQLLNPCRKLFRMGNQMLTY